MNKLNEIQQKLNVPKAQYNQFGGYNYRSCEDILEAVKPLLGEATLIINDEIVLIGERYYIKATAKLQDKDIYWKVSGFARESEIKKGMDASQITGSSSSYARKYALNGLFCIDDTKDADTKDNTKDDDIENNTNQNILHYQKIIGTAIMAMSDNDKEKAREMLISFTKSDDGKYKGLDSVSKLKSEKQAKFIINNKIKQKYSMVYSWGQLEKNYEVVMLEDDLPFPDEPIPEDAKAK